MYAIQGSRRFWSNLNVRPAPPPEGLQRAVHRRPLDDDDALAPRIKSLSEPRARTRSDKTSLIATRRHLRRTWTSLSAPAVTAMPQATTPARQRTLLEEDAPLSPRSSRRLSTQPGEARMAPHTPRGWLKRLWAPVRSL